MSDNNHGTDFNPQPERPSVRSARVAKSFGEFSAIRVSYDPQNELVAALDEVRLTALEVRDKRLSLGRKLLMPVMRTIAEMGVGKTWAAEKLMEMHNTAEPGGLRILLATLNTSGTQASVPGAILVALGKTATEHGTPVTLWGRANKGLRENGVEMVIFDETNYASRRPTIGPVIGGDIMTFLADGNVAVAFLGTEDANKLFNRAPALRDRLKAPVVMKALDWDLEPEKGVFPERDTFISFLDQMDDAMMSHGLLDEKADFANEGTARLLWEVCRGRIRPLCLLLEEAAGMVARRGGPLIIDHNVLAEAVESHSIPNEVIGYNPFTGEKPQ